MKRPSEISTARFPNVSRREFVKMAVAAGAAMAAGPQLWGAESQNEVPLRPLGRTGEKVSAIGLGGYHIGTQGDEQLSIRIVRNQKWNQPQRRPLQNNALPASCRRNRRESLACLLPARRRQHFCGGLFLDS